LLAIYFREWDHMWFYVYTCIRFLLGIAGFICGLVLENRLGADVSNHKGLGVFLVLQVRKISVHSYWIDHNYWIDHVIQLI
jgi:hypothetical protein